jgi:hypothetical protein
MQGRFLSKLPLPMQVPMQAAGLHLRQSKCGATGRQIKELNFSSAVNGARPGQLLLQVLTSIKPVTSKAP